MTFALQLANRVSWFCCCVWSENVLKKNGMCLAYVGVGGACAVLGVLVGSLSPTSTKNVCV